VLSQATRPSSSFAFGITQSVPSVCQSMLVFRFLFHGIFSILHSYTVALLYLLHTLFAGIASVYLSVYLSIFFFFLLPLFTSFSHAQVSLFLPLFTRFIFLFFLLCIMQAKLKLFLSPLKSCFCFFSFRAFLHDYLSSVNANLALHFRKHIYCL